MPEIWAPVRPSMPAGFSSRSMIGPRDDLAVEDDRERVGPVLEAGGAALGDVLGDLA